MAARVVWSGRVKNIPISRKKNSGSAINNLAPALAIIFFKTLS